MVKILQSFFLCGLLIFFVPDGYNFGARYGNLVAFEAVSKFLRTPVAPQLCGDGFLRSTVVGTSASAGKAFMDEVSVDEASVGIKISHARVPEELHWSFFNFGIT